MHPVSDNLCGVYLASGRNLFTAVTETTEGDLFFTLEYTLVMTSRILRPMNDVTDSKHFRTYHYLIEDFLEEGRQP